MASILEQYRKQLEEDRKNENYDTPTDIDIDPSYVDDYKRELDKQRGNILSNERQYEERLRKTLTVIHESEANEIIQDEIVDKVIVKHFFCPECGKELVSKAPPMFNPFTMERICLHECQCGKRYNLDYAYPRFVLLDKEGNEIKAYGN